MYSFERGEGCTLMTGSGKSIFSRMTGLSGSQSVSPVVVSLQPTRATMSPARATSMSVRSLAFISSMRPMRSRLFLTELSTDEPFSSTPEYMRANVSEPTKGSVMILKASAENGSSSDDGRVVAVSPSMSVPAMSSTSVGAGM